MEQFFTNFHFLRPWWLLLLAFPLFFYWRYFRSIRSKSSWENVCDKKLLNFLLIKGSSGQRRMLGRLSLIAFCSTIIAIAGPTWKKLEAPMMSPENPVMILLNLSSEMKKTPPAPSRLERAKFKIKDMLSGLKTAQTGLIVYTNEPFLITPITDDPDIIKNLLPAVNFDIMPSNGDRLDRAIAFAAEKLQNGGYLNGNIVIFTSDVGERLDLALEAAKNAAAQKYRVSVIEANQDKNEKLKLISRYGNGIYEMLSPGDQDIMALDNFINQNISELKQSENMQSMWIDSGYYLSIIPLLCCLYFFRRGIFAILLLFGFAGNAQAGWFLNNNQEGLQAFNGGDFKQAEQKFEDKDWKAAAQYRLGDYKAAAQNYAGKKDITSQYNLGNALAKSGKIEDAIKKYEEVLKEAPEHEDAKFNLEYLKKQQQQNQQQQNQNQNQNQDQNQDNSQSQQDRSQNNSGENDANKNQPSGQDENQDEQQDNQNQQQNQQGDNGDNQQQGQQNQQDSGENQDNQNGEEQDQQGDKSDEKEENEEPKPAGGELQKGDDDNKYDEERQARAQQFRQIPEDPGGLLKAFIAREYRLNRYGDE